MFTTYLNENGKPMVRSCSNCTNWKELDNEPNSNKNYCEKGYCRVMRMFHCKSLEPSCMAITKHFYVCGNHKFKNEDDLRTYATKISFENINNDTSNAAM